MKPAWESSDAWMKRKKLSLSVRDYHSLHWLLYTYLPAGSLQRRGEVAQLDEEGNVRVDLRR
jgi:hypothetical protein